MAIYIYPYIYYISILENGYFLENKQKIQAHDSLPIFGNMATFCYLSSGREASISPNVCLSVRGKMLVTHCLFVPLYVRPPLMFISFLCMSPLVFVCSFICTSPLNVCLFVLYLSIKLEEGGDFKKLMGGR